MLYPFILCASIFSLSIATLGANGMPTIYLDFYNQNPSLKMSVGAAGGFPSLVYSLTFNQAMGQMTYKPRAFGPFAQAINSQIMQAKTGSIPIVD